MKRALLAFLVPTALATACFLGGNGNPGTDDGGNPDSGSDGATVLPFTADSPYAYVSKVKNLLTGLPVTQDEMNQVTSAGDEPSKKAALVKLIDAWMGTPQYTAKMQTFFQLAFQQTQIGVADFVSLIPNQGSIGQSPQIDLLIQNVKEMFARTVLKLIADGKPLSDAFTTNTFMMTPPLMELFGFMDQNQVDDANNVVDKFKAAHPTLSIIVQDSNAAITQAQTWDPKNQNFMNWYFKGLSAATGGPVQPTEPSPQCQSQRNYKPEAHTIHFLMYGQLDVYRFGGSGPSNVCQIYTGANANSVFTNADFAEGAWKPVTIRKPTGTETVTPFWDATMLRSSNTLLVDTPRVGFYSMPAFHANWPTNMSNEMRVTINQAFIVGLGAQVDGTDPTDPGPNPPALDQAHVAAGDACLGCHRILDPSRAILQATYSFGYGTQNDGGLASQPGWFVFNGTVDKNMSTLSDLGAQLAQHVMYPAAWAQKLCFYANSQACDPADPEFLKIVSDFKASGEWKTLVEDVFSSPIVTNAVSTMTATTMGPSWNGELVSVARRDHLCSLLNARLGLTDACGLDIVTTKSLVGIPEIAAGLPSDGYGRGAPVPVLPAQPTLFFRAGLENICEMVANQVVDTTGSKYASSSQAKVDAAIADFVSNLMGLVPSDPSSAQMSTLLHAHYTKVAAYQGAKPTDALRSTFIVACESPNVAGIGL